ncbi:MAG: DUF6600 domain-containing protein [Thermoanaerobaculia bacterium]
MIPLDRSLVRVGLALGLFALTALPAAASRDGSYGYFRVIEGSATLMQSSGGDTDREPAEINQPILAGDRIWVPERSRAEIVLADRNILRIDGGSEVVLEQLAASPDRDDPATVLRLQDGNILLTVTTDSLGDQLPRVDTANAAIYPQDFGTYRITATEGRFTELVVRRGKAEVVTDRGSQIVRADESAYVEGERSARVDVESAGAYDALERWADKLEGEGRYADNDYVDDDLRYQAAPLTRYGSWIHVQGRPYWRPRVEVGWRPYWQGRWGYTPAGLAWISYEPWGWVPYHYGSWDYLPGYGWAWAPGRQWAPAWVYWYWGPSYVGWCPTGYYTSFYHQRYPYFRAGLYGWAGGSWDGWDNWSFIRHDYFRGYRNGYRDGYKDGRHDGWDVRRFAVPRDEARRAGPLERGVITTDTRPLTPDNWNEPRQAIRVLTDQPIARRLERGERADGALPDVTPFIQRRPDLPDNVVRTVVPRDGTDGNTGRGDQGSQGVARPRVADRPGGGTPWEGGVISTDPSDRSRSGGSTPRVRVPNEGSTSGSGAGTPGAERPRVGRPQPGQGGGAPRPDSADRTESGSTPRVRVPHETQQGGESPRARRPEAGSPGGAPRPQADDNSPNDGGSSRPQVRQPRQDDGGRSDEVRSRRPEAGSPGGSPRPSRPESEQPSIRRTDPPRSYDAPRTQDRDREQNQQREQEMRSRARDQEREQEVREQAREHEQQREQEVREQAREREPERESPPAYERPSRPEPEREEARPAESSRDREESARPPSRERSSSSRGSESRGNESRGGGSGRSGSSSRGSRSRPPGDGDGGR